jgi:hypothetical protein
MRLRKKSHHKKEARLDREKKTKEKKNERSFSPTTISLT